MIQTTYVDAAEPLRLDIAPDRDRVIVRPVGEIDLATVGRLETGLRELVDAGFRSLVLDLEQLTFVDSQGMRCILEFARELGDSLTVLPGPPAVQRAFEIAGLSAVIPFQPRSTRLRLV